MKSQEKIDAGNDLVRDFFGQISGLSFLKAIGTLLDEGAYGVNETSCYVFTSQYSWPSMVSQLNEVSFQIDIIDAEDIVPYEDFLKYLRIACEAYITRNPQDEAKVLTLLQKHDIALRP